MEEVRRTLVAFEMDHRSEPFQPTVLGELYFNKPPLFNWLILLCSKVFGWNTLTPRIVTLCFTLATTLTVYLASLRLTGNRKASALSALIFLTFADVLFWYGWMAEIEMALTFVTTAMILSLYMFFESGRRIYLVAGGLLCGLGFSLKGFPALAFFGLTLLSLSLIYRRFSVLLSKEALLTYCLAFLVSAWWIPLSEEPLTYVKTLWRESFSRVEATRNLKDTLIHLLTYPLLNLKQTLPASAVFLFLVLKERVLPAPRLRPLVLLVAVNYLPYLISPEARGRYVLPLFPLVALIMGDTIARSAGPKTLRLLLVLISASVVLRVLYGAAVLPYVEKVGGDPERLAEKVLSLAGGRSLACGCADIWDVCLYAGMMRGSPLYSPSKVPDWELVLDCRERDLPPLEVFTYGDKKVYLYPRYNHSDGDLQRREDLHPRTRRGPGEDKGGPRQAGDPPQNPRVQGGLP
jgi:4-amino-4-deoxy-L-arabinose transferase-like glycosyltransferase